MDVVYIVVVAVDARSHVWKDELVGVFKHENAGKDKTDVAEDHDVAQPADGHVAAVIYLAHLHKGKADAAEGEDDGHDVGKEAENLASYACDHHYGS